MALHMGLLVLLIIIYFSIDDNSKIKQKVEKDIFNGDRCKVKDKYLMLRHDGFFQALAITSMLGAHLGIILLVNILKKFNGRAVFIHVPTIKHVDESFAQTMKKAKLTEI